MKPLLLFPLVLMKKMQNRELFDEKCMIEGQELGEHLNKNVD